MKNVLIIGAAGRDFHNFNVLFRNDKEARVVAFTAAQIPGIADRKYPAVLAGPLYPEGIPILDEKDMAKIIREKKVGEAILSYSDLSYTRVGNIAAQVMAAGADFKLVTPEKTMLKSSKKVIAVCAVRTGCGKSQTSRKIVTLLRAAGKRVVAVRHPMPYGDLAEQAVQRFATLADLDKHKCTIEEREEYEQYVRIGAVIYAGVDYEAILRSAEKEADIVLWDGGNNDTPFYRPDLMFTVVDPLRPGHEITYYPGESNLYLSDYIVINKEDAAKPSDIALVEKNVRSRNPRAKIIHADSAVTLPGGEKIRGKKVLVIEDGPTLTHGGMAIGAGYQAATKYGAKLIDPRPFAVGSIKETYAKYPQSTQILPAMGYSDKQVKELEQTINSSDAEFVVSGTPIDLNLVLKVEKPLLPATYELAEKGNPNLPSVLKEKGLL